jgi:hypothetical protein
LGDDFDAWYSVMKARDRDLMAIVLQNPQFKSTIQLGVKEEPAFIDACMAQTLEEMRCLFALDTKARQFHENAYANCRGRAFFITENGYTGTAQNLIQAGYLVALQAYLWYIHSDGKLTVTKTLRIK